MPYYRFWIQQQLPVAAFGYPAGLRYLPSIEVREGFTVIVIVVSANHLCYDLSLHKFFFQVSGMRLTKHLHYYIYKFVKVNLPQLLSCLYGVPLDQQVKKNPSGK